MNTLRRLLAIAFGIFLSILIVEAGVRALYSALPMNLQIALRDVRVSPFSEQRLAPPPLWQADADYLTIVRPGAVDSLQAGSPTVTFHVSTYSWWGGRVGFRSPQPQDGAVQAVALGDSHTFCFTDSAACWVDTLAAKTGLRIANLGQPVTGSVSHARRFYDFVAKPELGLKQPGLVIWQFYGNDYNDDYGLAVLNKTNKTPPAAAQSSPRPPDMSWLGQNSAIYALLGALLRGRDEGIDMFVDPYRLVTDGLDISFGQSYIRDSFDMTQPRNLEGEQLSYEAILKTRDRVEKNGGKFVLTLMPTKEEVYRPLTETKMGKAAIDAIAAPRLRLLAFCTEQKLTCLDLLPALEAQAGQKVQFFFRDDPHLNAQGNRIVAAAIGEFLKAQGLAKYAP